MGRNAANNVINIGSEKVYSLDVILDEVVEIFDTSPYIHIGADEAIDNLKGDPLAEAMMKNLEGNVHELYRHFIVRMNDMVKVKIKPVIWEGFKRGK